MIEQTYIEVPKEALRTILDVAANSMDFGSGFWDSEETDAARAIAELLGDVCPNAVTPVDMLPKYPKCEGVSFHYRSRVLGQDFYKHDAHEVVPA